MSDPTVVSRILEHVQDASRLFVARGLDPDVRAELAARAQTEELPCVRGEAILPTDLIDDDVVIVGHPNWFGRFDPVPLHCRAVVVAEPRLGAHRPISAGEVVRAGDPAGPETAEAGRHRARYLAKRLGQLDGVVAAYGTPISAVFITLVPVDPEQVTVALPGPAEAASTAYPELPGGVRIDASGVAETDAAAYAAAMEDAIRSARG